MLTANRPCSRSIHPNNVQAKSDLPLWRTYVVGIGNNSLHNNFKQRCISYEIPITKNGEYELIIKLVDYQYKFQSARTFTVKFNGIDVFPQVNPFLLYQADCQANELVSRFTVEGNYVTLAGFPKTILSKSIAKLMICNSYCNQNSDGTKGKYIKDPNPILSAFSVVRFLPAK